MRDSSVERGAEFALVYFPSRGQAGRDVVQDVLDDLESADGVPVLDLHGRIERPGDSPSPFFERDVHLNDHGHARAAALLVEFLGSRTSLGRLVVRRSTESGSLSGAVSARP
jgi:hypothetical protein